jgi:hypothetical protein
MRWNVAYSRAFCNSAVSFTYFPILHFSYPSARIPPGFSKAYASQVREHRTRDTPARELDHGAFPGPGKSHWSQDNGVHSFRGVASLGL